MADIDSTRIIKFIKLHNTKKEIAVSKKENQEAIDDLEQLILKHFEQTGTSKITMNGNTVYLQRKVYGGFAKNDDGEPISKEDVIEALKKAGLADICEEKIMQSTLNNYCRELSANGEELPAALDGIIKINPVYRILTRKGS